MIGECVPNIGTRRNPRRRTKLYFDMDNLSKKDLKIMIIKMIKEFTKRIDTQTGEVKSF